MRINIHLILAKLFTTIIFCITPLSVIIIFFVSSLHIKEKIDNKKSWLIVNYWGFTLTAFISYFILLKEPVSDMEMYIKNYELASKLNLFDYISLFNREYLYYLITWIFNLFFFGNIDLFILFSTFIPLYLINIYIQNYCKSLEISQKNCFYILTIILMNPILFSISGHLFRQLYAIALLPFALHCLYNNKKIKSFLIFLISFFFHSSSLLIFSLNLFVNLFRNKFINLFSSFFLLFITIIVLLNSNFYQFFNNFRWFEIIFLRISALVKPDVIGLSQFQILFSIFLICFSLRFYLIKNNRLFLFFLLFLILLLVFDVYGNYNEISMRVFFYSIPLLTIFLCHFIQDHNFIKIRNINLFLLILLLLNFVLFVFSLIINPWTYNFYGLINIFLR